MKTNAAAVFMVAALLVGLIAWPSLAGGQEKKAPVPAASDAAKIEGAYDVYVLDQPQHGVVAKFGIKATSSTEFAISGLYQDWNGTGKISGKKGYYDWKFADGKSGRTTIEVVADGSLKGHVVGSGFDWWYLAKRLKVPE